MAIAHVATEYVFSDFLLKEPNQARYRSVRTELALDKLVTCVAVGLPLLLISLAFAQEVSVGEWRRSKHHFRSAMKPFGALFMFTPSYISSSGTQISCFAPANFSWKQAAYVDSYCWAAVHTHTLPLWLHKVTLHLCWCCHVPAESLTGNRPLSEILRLTKQEPKWRLYMVTKPTHVV